MLYTCTPKRDTQCPDGGIGRRDGLKHHCLHGHAGSTPALGTGHPPWFPRGIFCLHLNLTKFTF